MPSLGLGTWQSPPGAVEKAVDVAIDSGYRLIDTAFAYGNEAEIGAVLERKIAAGVVKRDEVFVTTKLWTPFHKRADVETCLRKSLAKLRLDYVDLYIIHLPCAMKKAADCDSFEFNENGRPVFDNVDLLETWQGMEDVFRMGLAKAIGLSNFNAAQVQRIYEHAVVKPHNLQVECHAYFPQRELHDLCRKLNISFTAYAPLGSPARKEAKTRIKFDWPDPGNLLEDPAVVAVASAHGKTPAQVLLRWLVQRGISVIPKSTTPERIHENFNIWDFHLSVAEMAGLSSLKIHQRLFMQDFVAGHPEDPLRDERH